MIFRSGLRAVATAADTVFRVSASQDTGRLAAAIQFRLKERQQTALDTCGVPSIYNGVRGLILANQFEAETRPIPEKVIGPIKIPEERKHGVLNALDSDNTVQELVFDASNNAVVAHKGWIALGEKDRFEGVPFDRALLRRPGPLELMFRRPARDREVRTNPTSFAFSPEFMVEDDLKWIRLHCYCLRRFPAPRSPDAVLVRPSKTKFLKAAAAIYQEWKKGEPHPYVEVMGKESVAMAVKTLTMAQSGRELRTAPGGFCVYPEYLKGDQYASVILRTIPNTAIDPI